MAYDNDDDTQVQQLAQASQCSIELSRTSKMEPSWKIKQYHQPGDEAEALVRIATVDSLLMQAFVLKTKSMPELLSGAPAFGRVPYANSMADTANSATSN